MSVTNIDMYTGGVLGLIYSAGPVAKAVVALLLIFSIISWTIMLVKWRQYARMESDGERFTSAVREANSFKKLLTLYREDPDNAFSRLIFAAYREIVAGQKDAPPEVKPDKLPLVENALRIAVVDETERLERRLSFLATTANAAPFIGLFGTVWGIMESFREIGLRGTTSLTVVAPGISEALIATAIGLFAAIPAVLGYNYFLGRLKRLVSRMENASLYIINIIEK